MEGGNMEHETSELNSSLGFLFDDLKNPKQCTEKM